MPLLSRVLHPASRRKPPIRKHRSDHPHCLSPPRPPTFIANRHSAQVRSNSPTPWKRRSGYTICSTDQGLSGQSRLSPPWVTSSAQAHSQPETFSDLYPVFRFLLESRHHVLRSSPQGHRRSQPAMLASRLSRTCTFNSSHFQLLTVPWRHSSRGMFGNYSTKQPGTPSPSSAGTAQQPSRQFSTPTLLTVRPCVTAAQTGPRLVRQQGGLPIPIPCRRISLQHSTRTLEGVTDMRIPEEFLSIEPTQQAIQSSPTVPVIKKWVTAQIAHARHLFLKQNYMQALVVIDKAKEHEYMRELDKYPHAIAPTVVRWHIQDLHLVEFCCRLLCAHEARIGNIDIIETLQYLNSSVLEPAGEFKTLLRTGFWSNFDLQDDPMLDYTLAVLSRNWNQLAAGSDLQMMTQAPTPEQRALASAMHPFLNALVARRLLPSKTSILQDLAEPQVSGSSLRKTVLDVGVLVSDHANLLRWIRLWSKRDHQDWLDQWHQPEIKQWLTGHLLQSDRPDWAMDLFRLSHNIKRDPYGWLHDFYSTAASSPTTSAMGIQTLAHTLQLSAMDSGAFAAKKVFYKEESWVRSDLLQAWLSGLLDPRLRIAQQDQHPVEKILWREMAMIGVLSRDMTREDVLRSLSQEILAVVNPTRPPLANSTMISARNAPLRADRYRDPLTDYLEGQSYQGFENSFARDHWNRRSEASLLLKQAIQELMSHHYSGPSSEWSLLRAYKDLLHSVAHHTTTRLGHMGLISLVSESRFRSLHGVDIWSKTVLAVRQEVDARSSRPKDALDLTNIPEVLEYVSVQLRSDLGKMCAIAANSAWSPMTRWTGRFSDWYLTITASSEHTKYIARSLHSQKSVQPGSIAYRQAISSLLHDREYDLAVALHCRVYVLEGVKSPGRDNVQIPDQEDLGRLVHALTTSSRDPRDIDRAQWIVDQYLQREESLHGSEQDVNKTCVLNTQIATMLAGAWSRCAEFTKVRRITDTMQRYGIQPNMVFYNTFLQALVDLAPFSRNGRRTTGSGKQAGMRELGREMMVRQLIHSRQRGDHVASEETQGEHVRSGLDVGWNLFQDIVSRSLRRPPQGLSSISRGLDSPSILKKLIVQTRPSLELSRSGFTGPEDGVFRPDAFTFSILLGAFARRGEIEPISELFVEMKQLGLEPDTAICTILANAFAKKGDLRSVDRVVQEARNRNLDPGLYLANVILNGLVEANVSASKIRESLDGMVVKAVEAEMATLDNETEIPVRKVEHPWPHLHEHRHRHQHRYENADSRNHSRSGDRILNRSSGQNGHSLGVDDVSLTTLIKYHVRQGDLESAQDVFETMLQAGLIPGKHVYALLMGACIRKKDILAGLSMIRAMRTQSMFFPDAKAWKGLLRCALELEKHGMPKDTKMINWSLNGFQHSAASIAARFVQDPRSRPQQLNRGPVVLVLEELSVVLHEINMARTLPAPRPRGCESERAGFNASLAAKDYLLGILRSSWVPPSDNKSKHDSPAVDGSTVVVNIDIKGKNGLLRRLLDHLLRGSSVSDLGTSEDDMENQSLVGRESTVEIEQRCEEAVWLVRLVEASRIELGPRWKWDVVVRRMQSLTGEDPRSIVKRLNKKKDDYRRKDE